MKAKYKNRNLEKDRRILSNEIPLRAPWVLIVDPSSHCNLKCKFCPSGNRALIKSIGRMNQNMELGLFKKIIDDLAEFDVPIDILRLYKEGEPLMNPYFTNMVKYAKKSNNISRIDTTTNGVLLNKQLNKELIDSGINRIHISVNGVSENQIYNYTGVRVNFEDYINNIAHLCQNSGECEIYIKGIKDNLSEEDQSVFMNIFGELADQIFFERLAPDWPGFSFNNLKENFEVGIYEQEIKKREVCPYLFYTMVVNSDGTVSSCVGDWAHKQILGNVEKNSIKEIWLGNSLFDMRKNHLNFNRREYFNCNVCGVLTNGCFDFLDENTEKILNQIKVYEESI